MLTYFQDVRPAHGDSTQKRRDRSIYLTATANLNDNLHFLRFLGDAMPGMYPPLTRELQRFCDGIHSIQEAIPLILGSFQGPYIECYDVWNVLKDFERFSETYEVSFPHPRARIPLFLGDLKVPAAIGYYLTL